MDLLEGESFAARLAREHALLLSEVAQVMLPVCAAIGAAHALGIVHRDLKPDNIFLAVEDGATCVKVLDFGIAKLTATEGDAANSGATTGTGILLGTPFYMAPEQMFGEKDVDARADLWALGVILYEALAGQRPTQGANVGQIFKLATRGGIVPLRERAPSLPLPVLDLVSKLLERDRDRRLSDLREVVAVLATHAGAAAPPFETSRQIRGLPRDAAPSSASSGKARTPALDTRRARRPGSSWGAFGVVALGVAGAVSTFALRGREAGAPRSSDAATISASSLPIVGTSTSITPTPTTDILDAGSPAPVVASSARPPLAKAVRRSLAPATRSTATTTSPVASTAFTTSPAPPPQPTATTPKMSDDL